MQVHLTEERTSENRLTPLAYSTRQAAFVSSLSIRQLMKALASGHLRSFKKGRRRVIFREDLEQYLRSAGEGR